MKKLVSSIVIVLMLITVSATAGDVNTASAVAQEIIVKVNDVPVVFDVKPIILNDRTMVPLRAIFEVLGAQVTWDDATKTIIALKGKTIIVLQADSTTAFVNDEKVTLDAAPKIIDGRTLVPTRFIAESLNAKVDWDATNKAVLITTASEEASATTAIPN